jgi:ubiquitin-protein ligase
MSVRLKKDIELLKLEMSKDESVVETVEGSIEKAFSANGSMSNIKNFTIILRGPSQTPYDGGKFKLKVTIPEEYPMKPPRINFLSPIKHPNIKDVDICIDILKTSWSPALMLYKVFLSLSSLLENPNPDDPLDPDMANQFKKNYEYFTQLAIESSQISTKLILKERQASMAT